MLAQNFKTPAELSLTGEQFTALAKTLVLLETDKLTYVGDDKYWCYEICAAEKFTGHFNMAEWIAPLSCGNVACIGGTAELISGYYDRELFLGWQRHKGLAALFSPTGYSYEIITAQAAHALRNYLTTGDPDWDAVLCIA